jgi:tetratricopeptide (TPR) repeat protein
MKRKQQVLQKKIKSEPISRVRVQTAPKGNIYLGISLVLLLTFILYRSGLQNGFVNWDDDKYIIDNPLIRSLDLGALFSGYVMGNYHPLTMLVYAIEYQLFGTDPTGYHTVNMLLHLLNTFLVFLAIARLSRNNGVGLVAALFFGIHPMHVESVAWASELKDLLYTAFFLCSWIFYMRYLDAPEKKKYHYIALLFFLAALLSKAMAVSLLPVLFLTDYFRGRKFNRPAIVEKIPWFLLAIIFGIVAVLAQKSLGATESTVFLFWQRIFFAAYAFVMYLVKLVFPLPLSSYYPYPVKVGESLPAFYYLFPFLVLGLILYLYFFQRASRKIIFGLVFFTLTVFLVLQLLPVGDTIMADRYSYIPSIGIFYLAGEGFMHLWKQGKKWMVIGMATILVIFYSYQAVERIGKWESSLTLWNDVIDQYPSVPAALYNRGLYYQNEGQDTSALSDLNRAIAARPDYADAYNNRGTILLKLGRPDEALQDLSRAIQYDSTKAQAYFNRGYIYYSQKRFEEALRDYTRVIDLKPDPRQLAIVHNLRGLLFMAQSKYTEALEDFNKAIEFNPEFAEAINNRGSMYVAQQKWSEAIRDFSAAISIKNNYAEAYFNRGLAAFNSGNRDAGCRDWQQASQLGHQAAAQTFQLNCNSSN